MRLNLYNENEFDYFNFLNIFNEYEIKEYKCVDGENFRFDLIYYHYKNDSDYTFYDIMYNNKYLHFIVNDILKEKEFERRKYFVGL